MKPGSIAVVGAAETTNLGKIPNMSNLQLHADAALNALKETGLEIISEAARPEAAELVVVVHVVIVKGTETAADVRAVVAFIPRTNK